MSVRRSLCALLSSLTFGLGCGNKLDPAPPCGTEDACECNPGDSGCSPCQPGYRTALVGSSCVPTCNAPEMSCGEHGACEEGAQGATCVCEPGYVGASCGACANGLSLNENDQCFGKLEAPALLSLASIDQQIILGALRPPAWSFLPLSTASSEVTDVAYDAKSGDVYALEAGRLVSLDLASGKLVTLTPASVDLGRSLCLDDAGRRAFTASTDAIYEVSLQTLEVSERGSFGARALEYDAARDLLLGVDDAGKTFELGESEARLVGEAPSLEGLGMAFDAAAGRAYFLGSEPESDDARMRRYCSATLSRLGAVPAWQTSVITEPPLGKQSYTVDYTEADSALIVVPLVDSEVRSVRVATGHPDSVVCIIAEGGSSAELTVELTAAARPSFIVVAAADRPVALDVTELAADGGTSVIVHTAEQLTVSGSRSAVAEHDDRSWSNLGLWSLADFEPQSASALVLMDWRSQATLPLTLSRPLVSEALAWVGAVP
jgi:hypothetical protein